MNEFKIEGTTLAGYAGNGGTVVIPDSVTTIGAGAFEGCTSLMKVVIPDSVTTIDKGAFYGCPCEKNIKRRMTMKDHEGKLSECCGAHIKLHDICSECGEHCEPENKKGNKNETMEI